MMLMPCRYDELKYSLEGLNQTEVSLISTNGNSYWATGGTDDKGMYFFVPKLAKLFGISLDTSIDVFLGFLILFGTAISISCFFLLFKQALPRIISFVGIFLIAFLAFRNSDVYIAGYFCTASILPLFIVLSRNGARLDPIAVFVMLFSGIIIGISNFIRFHSGTGMLIFVVSWIFLTMNSSFKKKCVCLALLLIAVSSVMGIERMVYAKRDRFLANSEKSNMINSNFPFWHLVYIGLGYLENNHGLFYKDTCGKNFIETHHPGVPYLSQQYDVIMKRESFSIIQHHFLFFLKTVLFKFGVLFYKILKYLNYGLIFCLYVGPSFRSFFPVLLAALFYMIPGLVLIPEDKYVLGMLTVVTLYGVFMICLGIEKYQRERRSFKVS